MRTDTVIIGAGLTGMTAGFYLRKAGHDFLVLEKEGTYGGAIQTESENGFLYERGPNTGIIGNPEIAELFEDLGDKIQPEIAGDEVKKRYILKNGKWETLPAGLFEGIKTPLFTLMDKLRLLGEPFRKKGRDPHETLAGMVKRRMGQSFLDYAVDPFILGVYSGDPAYLVPKYALPKLYNLEQTYGSFIGGAIKKGFAKKDERERKATRQVFSVEGGLGNLTKALFESAGEERFLFNAKNIEVRPEKDYFIIRLKQNGQAVTISTKRVITAVGSFALPRILPFVPEELMKRISVLKYARVVEVVLGFKEWQGIPLEGFGGLIPYVENRDVLGYLFLSSFLRDRAPEKGALLTLFLGGVRKDHINDYPDDEIYKIVEKETVDLMKLPNFKPDLYKIFRHEQAISQYGADSGERFKAVYEIENKYKGLIIGGNLKEGIGMADRVKQGKRLSAMVIE